MQTYRNEKSLLIAYLLWFFLGQLGVHRLYLGRIKSGLALLLLLILPLVMFLIIGVSADQGTLSDMMLSALSVASIGMLSIWIVWYLADLILIAIMMARDKENQPISGESAVRRVFE